MHNPQQAPTKALILDFSFDSIPVMSREKTYEQLLEEDLQRLYLAKRKNPLISHSEAMRLATLEVMSNRPDLPPEDGSCPFNCLPNELLAYIFQIGVDIPDDDYDDIVEVNDEDLSGDEIVDADDKKDTEDGWEDEDDGDLRSLTPSTNGHSENDTDSELYDESGSTPFQVLVSHVCRRWRAGMPQISVRPEWFLNMMFRLLINSALLLVLLLFFIVAHDTPSLWTSLFFNERVPLSQTQLWVERSKGSPLFIYLSCELAENHQLDPDEYEKMNSTTTLLTREEAVALWPRQASYYKHEVSSKDLSDFLSIVLPHVPRWAAFHAEVTFYSFMYIILQRLAEAPSANLLRDLQLHYYEYAHDEDSEFFDPAPLNKAFCPFQGSAPKLESISLWGVHLDWDGSLSLFSVVKELELSYHSMDVQPSFSTFKAMLNASPHLETLTIMASGPSADEWPPLEEHDAIIHCPSIRHLAICYLEPNYLSRLFDRLSLPSVKDMAFDLVDSDYSSFAVQLSRSRPSCHHPHPTRPVLTQVENLKIVSLPADGVSVYSMLGQLTSLGHINLSCYEEDDPNPFFELLISPIGKPSLPTSAGQLVRIPLPQSDIRPGSNTASGASETMNRYFCPKLKQLTIRGLESVQLRRFVLARKNAGLPITKLFVSEDDEFPEEEEAWFRENVAEFDYFEPSDDEEDDDDDVFLMDHAMD